MNSMQEENIAISMRNQETEVNFASEVECTICLLTVPSSESIVLKLCGCTFCHTCLVQMIKLNVSERTLQRLKCPAKHDTQILRQEVKALVDTDTYLRYIRLTHENSVLMDPSRFFCPRPGCDAVCHSSGRLGARAVRCVECGFKFCSLCSERWPGRNHQCPEDLPVTKQPQKSEPMTERDRSDSLLHSQFFKDDIEGHSNTNSEIDTSTSSKSETKPNVKRCPRCGVPIEKREGCAHMKCARCGHSFCWSCLANLDHDYFLQHYESGPCRDALGYPPRMVHLYRFQAVCLVCGLGTLALFCAPFVIICSPCIIFCAPYIPRHFYNGENNESLFRSGTLPTYDEFGDDTDSDADPEQEIV